MFNYLKWLLIAIIALPILAVGLQLFLAFASVAITGSITLKMMVIIPVVVVVVALCMMFMEADEKYLER